MAIAVEPPRQKRRQALEPFTIEHFRTWTSELVLDTDEPWELEDFQADFVADVFRGFKDCWLVVPEENGKSTLIGGLALYHCEFRPHAAVSVAASSREQAQNIYRQAEGFVLRTPRMYEIVDSEIARKKGKRTLDVPRFDCLEGYRRINHVGGGRIQCFAADDRTGDGIIPTLCIIDELHRHRDLSLYRTWLGKLRKRNAQLVVISTAGEPGGEFEETRERRRQAASDVERSDTFVRAASEDEVLHEYAVPETGDVENLELVARANPASWITVEELRRKRAMSGMTLAHWRRFACNLPTRSESAAIMEVEWDAAGVDEQIPEGIPIGLGLDVAWKWDTTAMVPLWIRDSEFRLLGDATILEPPRDGSTLDPNLVENALLKIRARNPLHTVVMDTSQAEQLAEWISSELGAVVIDRGQGNVLQAEDYRRFMEALRNGWLKHTRDTGLRRHVLNAVARLLPKGDARFDRPAKARRSAEQDRRVIDALTAAAMVHNELCLPEQGGWGSI